MKLISWNVNGIRAIERKGELQNLITREQPDLLLLQETKASPDQLSHFLTQNTDYQQYYSSAIKKGYSGTSLWLNRTFSKTLQHVTFKTTLPNAPNLDEGRVSHLQFTLNKKIYDILGIYFPNGGKSNQAWKEKLVFYHCTLNYMNELEKKGHIVIMGGDLNVAHNEIDIARPKANDGKIGFHPQERAWVDKMISHNWIDVWRYSYPEKTEVYSWWSMRGGARERNVGWRIDYFFLAKHYFDQVTSIHYQKNQIGSDHCPLIMEITPPLL